MSDIPIYHALSNRLQRLGRPDESVVSATPRPFFGSTTTNGGASYNVGAATTTSAVISKYGTGASLRIFFSSSDLTLRPTIPSGMSVCHISYKPDPATVAAGGKDADIINLINWMQPGWILTFHHEPDNNGWTTQQIDDWRNMTNHLWDLKESTKPSVYTGPVFTGGLMANYTTDTKRDIWCKNLRGDMFGVDCDGAAITSSETSYDRISYLDEIQNSLRYMNDSSNTGFKQVTVPEFMTARVNPPDPDGSLRAAWFSTNAQHMIDNDIYAAMCWDSNPPNHDSSTNFNQLPSGSPELSVWQSLVASNPTTPRVP